MARDTRITFTAAGSVRALSSLLRPFELHRIEHVLQLAGAAARAWLRCSAARTGLPAVVVAAVAIVVAWHAARRGARLVLEVALAVALLLAASRLGLVRW